MFAALGEMSAQHRRLSEEGAMTSSSEQTPHVYAEAIRAATNVLKKVVRVSIELVVLVVSI